jgi:acyl homoserine lactone synthase
LTIVKNDNGDAIVFFYLPLCQVSVFLSTTDAGNNMLEIVQAGQAGKTSLLFDMHRLRKRVFKDRMGWNVSVTPGGLEIDDFDLPETVYLLALSNDGHVIGNWRLLPSTGPTMIRKVWPQFLDSIDMPRSPLVWEASRFAVNGPDEQSVEGMAQISLATQELFCGLTDLCLLCGIREIFTMYDMRIARLLKRLDCVPHRVSARVDVDGRASHVGCFKTDEAMLARLRVATGIDHALVTADMLPPVLLEHCRNYAALKKLPATQSQYQEENIHAGTNAS